MWSSSIFLSLLCATSLVTAQTPKGVYPVVEEFLAVNFAGRFVNQGERVDTTVVRNVPAIGLPNDQSPTGAKFLFMMVDLDFVGNLAKRGAPAAGQLVQPDDPEHLGGRSTYLHALIQDFELIDEPFGDSAILLKQTKNGPAPFMMPIVNLNTAHRYLLLLFDQPRDWIVPPLVAEMIARRTNFDLRAFIAQSSLPLPRYANWFIIDNDGTVAPPGPNGGNGGFQSAGVPVPPIVPQGAFVTTYPDGGPTLTLPGSGLATVSTSAAGNCDGMSGNGCVVGATPTVITGTQIMNGQLVPFTSTIAVGQVAPTNLFNAGEKISPRDGMVGVAAGLAMAGVAGVMF